MDEVRALSSFLVLSINKNTIVEEIGSPVKQQPPNQLTRRREIGGLTDGQPPPMGEPLAAVDSGPGARGHSLISTCKTVAGNWRRPYLLFSSSSPRTWRELETPLSPLLFFLTSPSSDQIQLLHKLTKGSSSEKKKTTAKSHYKDKQPEHRHR